MEGVSAASEGGAEYGGGEIGSSESSGTESVIAAACLEEIHRSPNRNPGLTHKLEPMGTGLQKHGEIPLLEKKRKEEDWFKVCWGNNIPEMERTPENIVNYKYEDSPALNKGRVPSDNPRVEELRREADQYHRSRDQHSAKAAEEALNRSLGSWARESYEANRDEFKAASREQEANRIANEDRRKR